MSISDTIQAKKYASIAETAAAQAKLSADKLESAPDYAAQAQASAAEAASSAQIAAGTVDVVTGLASQANQSALSAADSAAQAESAAGSAIGRSVRAPEGENLTELPSASDRTNTVLLFDENADPSTKSLSDFAVIDISTGKLPVSIIPSVALTEPFVVSSQAQMLALNAQIGDVAKRTDLGYSFMLGAIPATMLANWVQLTDNVLSQLAQVSGAGMIGASGPSSSVSTVQQQLDAKATTASLSANAGAASVGAQNIDGSGTTVQQALTSLNQSAAATSAKTGFNAVGRFLNLADLRAQIPTAAGQVVYVASAASTSVTEMHTGGGYFESVENTQEWPDDGGIVIKPSSGTLVWRRINFTAYDMQFWGVKADGVTDNATAITLATNYAKANKVILDAPAGTINTSQMVPIYNNMGIRGFGKAESTVFVKTSNNLFNYMNGATVALQVDALAGMVPTKWDVADFTMDSFCVHGRLENCLFRRQELTSSNTTQYGFFMGKAASPVIRQVNFEGGRTGIKVFNVFSGVMEMVAAVTTSGTGYTGVDFSDVRNGVMYMTGTSMDLRCVQVRGYQYGFSIYRLQYSTMTNCTAEDINPMTGETICYAFDFFDPYCIGMNACATEFVKGGQIRIQGYANPSYRPAIKITNYLAIDQQNPVTPTPIYNVDNGGITAINVVIEASELGRATSNVNLTDPRVSGVGAKVILIGCNGEDWTASGSGIFTRLA